MIWHRITSRLLMAALLASSLSGIAAFGEPSNADIINATESAHVLDPGTPVRVRVDGDKVYISAYRNPAENDNDCKINSVLLAKAVFTVAGDASRVTLYYYGLNGTSYAEVSVTAGDVKAYGSGATSQQQLLQSLVVEHKQQVTAADRITSRLANSAYLRPDYRVDIKPDNSIAVTSVLGDWVSDQDAKLEAVKIADTAAQAAPADATQIKVTFMDPRSPANRREISFSKDDVQDMWQKVQAAINAVQVAKIQVPIELPSMTARSGIALLERQTVLNRIKDAESKGVGMTPFIQAFLKIEAMVPGGDEKAIKEAVGRLQESLNEQAKAYKAAKEAKFSNGEQYQTAPAGGRQSNNDLGSQKYWFKGRKPFPPSTMAVDPEGVIATAEVICGGAKKADRDPDFLQLLDRLVQILKIDNNTAEAAKVAARANQMRHAGVH